MRVSIITPVFNASEYIETTANSVLVQSHKNWEWIIIDDRSTDDSLKILHELAEKDKRIRIFHNTGRKGASNCRNVGIAAASGHYLTFIDSDDIWDSEFIKKSIIRLNETNSGFVFSSYERWNEDFTVRFSDFVVPTRVDYTSLLYTCPISCLTAFIDISRYGKLYMPDLPKRQDYGLWLEYLKVIPFAIGIQEPLAKYRLRKNSLSAKKLSVIKYQFNIYHKHQKLGLLRSLFFLSTWAYYGFLKYRNTNR
jgi:teichuronic acid biosynthesis glycosyltransferase TuaG